MGNWLRSSQRFVTDSHGLASVAEPNSHHFVRSVASLSWLPGKDSNLSSRDQGCTGLAGLSHDSTWPTIMPYFGVPSPRAESSIQTVLVILLNWRSGPPAPTHILASLRSWITSRKGIPESMPTAAHEPHLTPLQPKRDTP